MRSLILLLFISIIFIVSGCGKEKAEGISEDESQTEQSSVENQNSLELKEKNNQVGSEAIAQDISDFDYQDDISVFEKEGYTYVIEPDYEGNKAIRDPSDLSFKVKVSVSKNNKWIVKNKITDLTKELFKSNDLKDVYEWYVNVDYKNPFAFVSIDTSFNTNSESNQMHDIYKLSFTKDGNAHYKRIFRDNYPTAHVSEVDSFSTSYTFVQGEKDTNFIQTISIDGEDKHKLFNQKGKELFTINVDNVSFNRGGWQSICMLNKDMLYFGDPSEVEIYNNKTKDLVWNSDGSKKTLDISEDFVETSSSVKNGIYTLSHINSTGDTVLEFTQLQKEQATKMASVVIPSDLKIKKIFMSLDKKNVNVFTLVEYKGKAAIQKYVFSRIDK